MNMGVLSRCLLFQFGSNGKPVCTPTIPPPAHFEIGELTDLGVRAHRDLGLGSLPGDPIHILFRTEIGACMGLRLPACRCERSAASAPPAPFHGLGAVARRWHSRGAGSQQLGNALDGGFGGLPFFEWESPIWI